MKIIHGHWDGEGFRMHHKAEPFFTILWDFCELCQAPQKVLANGDHACVMPRPEQVW